MYYLYYMSCHSHRISRSITEDIFLPYVTNGLRQDTSRNKH